MRISSSFEPSTSSGDSIRAFDRLLADGANASNVESGVLVDMTVTDDIYLSFEWQNATSAQMQMRVVPMIDALWGAWPS